MQCATHGIAGGQDGRCALCHRESRVRDEAHVRRGDRRIHKVLRVVIAIVAFVATYALLMALLDTTSVPTSEGSGPASGGPAVTTPPP